MVDTINSVMRTHSHDVILEVRDSRTIKTPFDKLSAFFSSFYSLKSKRNISNLLKRERPDVVHIHNLYPLFSPSILTACRVHDVPVVMSIHNYNLTCPIGTHEQNGKVCTKCLGGKEHWCIISNCTGSLMKSVNYALRSVFARKRRYYHDYINTYIAATEFVKTWLAQNGYSKDKIAVIPHTLPVPETPADPSHGQYALYAGRIEKVKGVGVFLEAAAKAAHIPCRLYGDGFMKDYYVAKTPPNAALLGSVPYEKMSDVYRGARFLVFPSLCFEGFGLVAAEAMSHGLPVIASNMGGIPEIVEDGVTGCLFEQGDSEHLSYFMKKLWNDPALCKKMGTAGRKKVLENYSGELFYKRYRAIYEHLIHRSA